MNIKKYKLFESYSLNDLKEDVEDYFIEFFDENKDLDNPMIELQEDLKRVVLWIETKPIPNEHLDFKDYLKNKKADYDRDKRIGICLDRLLKKHPSLYVGYHLEKGMDTSHQPSYHSFIFSLVKYKVGDFYRISGNLVNLSKFTLLQKILVKVKNQISLSLNGYGSNPSLFINFKSKEFLENNKDYVISQLLSLKLDGEDFIYYAPPAGASLFKRSTPLMSVPDPLSKSKFTIVGTDTMQFYLNPKYTYEF